MTPETLMEVWKQEEDKCKMLQAKYIDLAQLRGVCLILYILYYT